MFDLEYIDRKSGEMRAVTVEYWQDGLAMVHRFRFEDNNTLVYRNRYSALEMEERTRDKAQHKRSIVVSYLNTDQLPLQHGMRLATFDPTSVNANRGISLYTTFGASDEPENRMSICIRTRLMLSSKSYHAVF